MLLQRSNRVRFSGSRFTRLMDLYADNYWRLTRLFGPDRLAPGKYLSCCGDGIDLSLEMIERHPYTLEFSLSYLFADAASGGPDPSANVRFYRDARVAEVTTCYVGSRLEVVLGPCPAPRTVFDHRLRMNVFLNKWLDYLDERGHSRFTLAPARASTAPV